MGDGLIDSHIGPWGLSMNEMINTFTGPWGLYMMQRSFLLSGNALDSIGARMIWTRQKSGLCTGQSEAAITATPKIAHQERMVGRDLPLPMRLLWEGASHQCSFCLLQGGAQAFPRPLSLASWLERTLLWPWGLNVFLHTRAPLPSRQHVAMKPVIRLSQLPDLYAVSFDERAIGI